MWIAACLISRDKASDLAFPSEDPSNASQALLCSHAKPMDSAKTMTVTAAKLGGASGANQRDGGSAYHTHSIACTPTMKAS